MGYASAGESSRGRILGLRASWIKPLAYGVSAAEATTAVWDMHSTAVQSCLA